MKWVWLGLALWVLAACSAEDRRLALTEVPGGDPERGRAVMAAYGCGACHAITGVPVERASVGPPLEEFAYRQ
jgi:cytochrome c551/c552